MMLKALLLSMLAVAYVSAQGRPCDAGLDLGFILDSSSSIGAENFQSIRDFTEGVVAGLDVGQGDDQVRVSIARYNSWTDSQLFFNQVTNPDDLVQTIRDIPYYGEGTLTASALKVFSDHHLQPYSGWRSGAVPTVVIVVTDGMTQDGEFLQAYANELKAKTTRVLAVGVGNADNSELAAIATRPAGENVIFVDEFNALADAVQIGDVLNRVCETLDDVNECLVNNGDCEDICINTYTSFYCDCRSGFTLVGQTACVDINECDNNNGGCAQNCINSQGSYECTCNDGYILTQNGRICAEDSCFNNNDCEHNCNNVVGGNYFCSCRPGFRLNDDGQSCDDIDECAVNNGGCEESCNNTLGGYQCGCREGYGLRNDGRTCGVQCYTCNRALSNADCLEAVVCNSNERSCQTTTRRENGVLYISKECKQTEACANNFIQNPRTAWSPTQCNVANNVTSVCRCCCHENLCNAAGDCSLADDINIECPDPFPLFPVEPPANLTCSGDDPYTIGDVCTVNCPAGFEVVNGASELVCALEPRTVDGVWRGGQPGTCEDIDECATDNGGCSHTCQNTIGSFICSCPTVNPCEAQPIDLYFILDSSSSVGDVNFNMMMEFVTGLVSVFNIGQEPAQTRVGVMTYNRRVNKRFDLKDGESTDDVVEKLAAITYEGRGTRTAQALSTAAQECFTEARGRRAEVPLITVVITDGRSQDGKNIEDAAGRLNALTTETFVIGISDRVNPTEIAMIAGNDPSSYRIIDDYGQLDDELANILSDRLCTEPEMRHFLTSDERRCDFDECSIGNGGCSNNCTNNVGSYECTCPEGQIISNDRISCADDFCAIDNGGCQVGCVNIPGGRLCLCTLDQVLVGETDCEDYNDCLDERGGCSHECQDIVGGRICLCPEGMILGEDGETCETDSCFGQVDPMRCAQICENIPGGSYNCRCRDGYTLDENGHNCTEINECETQNGGCEVTCVNTPGSYRCECPEGRALREDGRSCGVACYHCDNELDNANCQTARSCPFGADSCFTTMRTRNNITRITKGCQQTLACINNLIQNPRDAGEGPSQCNSQSLNSKCECCCQDSLCNSPLCPYAFFLSGCPAFARQDVVFRGLQDDDTISPGGVATVECQDGYVLSQGGAQRSQLNCIYNFANQTSAWDADPSELDVCVDENECEINNGSCVPPATCVNLEGSYDCVCPDDFDDYILVDGTTCERDECADGSSGCSDNCTNTIGSFTCFCPPRYSIVEDGRTCDPDECQDANGGCSQLCVNTLGGHECRCRDDGYTLSEDGISCIDVNECLTNNGGCTHICTNLDPGYECSCPEDQILNPDGFSCRDNPCSVNNGGCAQVCTVNEDGFSCSCGQGFILLADGGCQDIDECAQNNGGCSRNCSNTDGSYMCFCPDQNEALAQDGKTCGRACYQCNGAATNEECNAQGLQVCPESAQSCENEVRVHDGRKQISKRCKQTLSCNNNFIQNPRQASNPTQCNSNSENDVCRCCCTGNLCNFNERPCAISEPCRLDQADVVIVADSSSSVRFDNFQKLKAFVKSLLLSFNLGEDLVHSALLRYNRDQDVRFNLDDSNHPDDVADAIDNTPYNGRGTRTGEAIDYVTDNLLTPENGARGPEVPKIVIVITDGRSQDDVAPPSQRLRASGAITYAVGIGDLEGDELSMIGGDPDRVFLAEDFDALDGMVLMRVQRGICFDRNECDENNGQCSHTCVNLEGSYRCECPEGLRLDADLRSCVGGEGRAAVDSCADNTECAQICINTLEGFNCSCNPGYVLGGDGRSCADLNECESQPCSHGCVNTERGFFCECPEDHEIGADERTCNPRQGPADCPAGWLALGSSCMRGSGDQQESFRVGDENCAADLGRLVKVNTDGLRVLIERNFQGDHWIGLTDRQEEGNWVWSDGEPLSLDAWGPEQPGNGDCAYARGYFFASVCGARRRYICELTRDTGFVVFSRSWPNGAQGKLYLPTGARTVRVIFPNPVIRMNVWFGSVAERVTASEYIITQNDIEQQSSSGQVEFTVDMRQRFPDYAVRVEVV